MKQFLIGTFLVLAATSQILAAEPTPEVLATFEQMFPDADEVEWDYMEEDTLHMAWFDNGGVAAEAFFIPEGEWVRTVSYVDESLLPQGAKDHFAQELPEVKEFTSVAMIEEPDFTYFQITFDVEEEGEEVGYFLMFDEEGNLLE